MAAHHFGNQCGIGRATGTRFYDVGDFAEVIGAEDARSHDRERPGRGGAEVVEAVNGTPFDAKHLARTDVIFSSVHCEGRVLPNP